MNFPKKQPAVLRQWSIRWLLSWFVIDSGVSIYYSAIYNVVLINLVALMLIGLPLLMTRNEFATFNGK